MRIFRNCIIFMYCCEQVCRVVPKRSQKLFPFLLLVPCVTFLSNTPLRIVCSARLFVGGMPVSMKRKESSLQF